MKLALLAILLLEVTAAHAHSQNRVQGQPIPSTNLRGGGRTSNAINDIVTNSKDSWFMGEGDALGAPTSNIGDVQNSNRRQAQGIRLLPTWELCSTSEQCLSGCCASRYSTDGKLKCTPLEGAFRPDICVTHSAPSSVHSSVTTLSTAAGSGGGSTGSTQPPSKGMCGGGNRGNGICADGTCCSEFGWCGIAPEHCAADGGGSNTTGGGSTHGTQARGSTGGTRASSGTITGGGSTHGTQPSSTGTCGGGNRGNGVCADGTCCSEFGWCGIAPEHCAAHGGGSNTTGGGSAHGTQARGSTGGTQASSGTITGGGSTHGTQPSSTGTCGGGNRGNGVCADGTCCSEFGWCGVTTEHCAAHGGGSNTTGGGITHGIQPRGSTGGTQASSGTITGGGSTHGTQPSSTGTCGGGNRGNGICADGTCCSEFGWCGIAPEHCAAHGGGNTTTGSGSTHSTQPRGSTGGTQASSGTITGGGSTHGTQPHGSTGGTHASSGTITGGGSTHGTQPSSTGTCGGGNRGNGICADGTCCSEFGWCGVTTEHCGASGSGIGGGNTSGGGTTDVTPLPSTGTCGGGNRGNGICADGTCCSEYGWCGVTPEHCAASGSGSGGGNTTGGSIGGTQPPSTGTCGGGHRGNGICADGTCCSEFGWCGTTSEHCAASGGGSPPPTTGTRTVTSPAITLTAEQIQVGINAKGDSVSVSQITVDTINEVTKDYSLYRQLAFVTHTIWESGSYQFREELDAANRGNYQDCDWNQEGVQLPTNDKLYYGRGYLQLSWCANYKAYGANRMYQGDPDLFYNQPELVATDDFIAMDSAAWFFENIVTDTTGHFGLTTKAINGQLECSGGSSEQAKKRYEIFVALANAVGMSGYSESGCYN